MKNKMFFKTVTTFLLIMGLLYSTQKLLAQDLLSNIPKTDAEFKASEKNVLATIDWLETTPFDKQEEKRDEQKTKLMEWITASPDVTIMMTADVLTFTKKNPDLLITFMGGYTKYCLQNNYSKDATQGTYAGIKSCIKVYQNLSLKKDKELEKLIELEKKGALESWVKGKVGDLDK